MRATIQPAEQPEPYIDVPLTAHFTRRQHANVTMLATRLGVHVNDLLVAAVNRGMKLLDQETKGADQP